MTSPTPLDLRVNDVSLNTFASFITTRNGWDSTLGLIGSNARVPGRDGEIWAAKDHGTARMVIQLTVTGTDANGAIPSGMTEESQFRFNMDNLIRLFSSRALMTVDREMEDETTRRNEGEVTAVIAPEYIDGTTTANMTVEITFPNPYWYDPIAVSITPAGSATNGRDITLTALAGSTAPINDAVLIVYGPATNPMVTDAVSGASIQYQGTLAAGQRWRIRCKDFISEIGTNLAYNPNTGFTGTPTSVLNLTQFQPGPRFLSLTPLPGATTVAASAPVINFTGTGLSTATTVYVYGYRKFIA